jgi:hypothetical protein
MFKFEKPSTWNNMPLFEKINYYKTVLTKDYAPYIDKIDAKIMVSAITNNKVKCAKLIRILDSPDDFHETDLNTNHIIKSAHGCGWNIDIDEMTTVDNVRNTLKSWNHTYMGNNEQHYQHIKPRFFIEEKINDSILGQTAKANVYLIRCIHGQPFAIGVRTELGQNSYDLSGNAIKEIEIQTGKPKHLSKMLEYAKLLSAPFEFVRTDFYIGADDHIYFSEFTFTPSGGHPFYPMNYEKLFGQLWT